MAGKVLSKAFGLEVRKLRAGLQLSQEELADRAALHRNYIGMIERGERVPTLLTVESIARGLKLRASQLVARAEERLR